MNKIEYIITGVKVTEQMSKAQNILEKDVIPREELFQERKRNNRLSKNLLSALELNA